MPEITKYTNCDTAQFKKVAEKEGNKVLKPRRNDNKYAVDVENSDKVHLRRKMKQFAVIPEGITM